MVMESASKFQIKHFPYKQAPWQENVRKQLLEDFVVAVWDFPGLEKGKEELMVVMLLVPAGQTARAVQPNVWMGLDRGHHRTHTRRVHMNMHMCARVSACSCLLMPPHTPLNSQSLAGSQSPKSC